MFAITGITGRVGGSLAKYLLADNKEVRAIVRDEAKGREWAQKGCQTAVAEIHDTEALTAAFSGAEGVFVMLPPNFDPSSGFPEVRAMIGSLVTALEKARPEKIVYLSTIGAQAAQTNLLTSHTLAETALKKLPVPVTFLRPAWFIENSAWDVAPARETGIIESFLQPLDKPVPMIATADIGRLAAELIQESWTGHRTIELEGPTRITPHQIAAAFSKLLHREVRAETVSRDTWDSLFRAQGMKNPGPRIRMLDGFNEGWIEFEHGEAGARKGTTTLETVLQELVEKSS